MTIKKLLTAASLMLLTACTITHKTSVNPIAHPEDLKNSAHFAWFDYSGDDDIFKNSPKANEYQNPILTGFHPDPSIVRVGDDFYLVNSTFGFFPGIPIFHSRDLVNWTQIGNAIHRPEQLKLDGLPLSGAGVYAPAIEYRNGTFYVINTCVGCGGNFVVTAKNPAGPWSDPLWIPHLGGIDPSIFFDDDGKTYIVHHREPINKKRDNHTAIAVQEIDLTTFKPLSDDVVLVDGDTPAPWHTEYIEGPHIYKINGSYYLSAPGGGTGYYHGQLVYKSNNIYGPYLPNPNNPMLTQLGLPDDREHPVTATGHADMFDDGHGNWWAVFLGTRVYDLNIAPQDPGNFHTGRETFMLPVSWKDGWPIILEKNIALPYAVKKSDLPAAAPAKRAMTGNFSEHETFKQKILDPHWLFIRNPHSQWWNTGDGLTLQARTDSLGEMNQPSFIGRRLAHMKASFSTAISFTPTSQKDEAGLLALQTDDFYYAFGLGKNAEGKTVLRIRKRAGNSDPKHGIVIFEQAIFEKEDKPKPNAPIYLKIDINKAEIDFAYSLNGKKYIQVIDNADAKILTSAVAGGFTGAVGGMYAEGIAP